MPKPLLSIGIIFKDNIRSLEHCLSALQPLRDAVPCELVLADTGSTDGSRAVAEKYADILIDFPWINDFAAARNAVIDRCTGRWYMTVDSDEYLDGNVKEIVSFLRANNRKAPDICSVVIRNYGNYELEGPYTDFMALRMIRMSTGARYTGSIHEKWDMPATRIHALQKTVFLHDGYVGLNGEAGKAKRERNITLIREEIAEKPELLMARLQFIESGATEPDLLDQVREAMALVERKVDGWQMVGPAIFQHAVYLAWSQKLPEIEEWTAKARELFPESLYIRVDVNYAAFMQAGEKADRTACVEHGEAYLEGIAAYKKGADIGARLISVIRTASPYWEQDVRLLLAREYLQLDKPERALELMDGLDGSLFDGKQTALFVQIMREAHARTDRMTGLIVASVWKGLSKPVPNEQRAQQRRQTFVNEERTSFQPKIRAEERDREGYHRLSCTLFAPLEEENEWGRTAAILAVTDPGILTKKLAAVKDWEKTPICALAHALEYGAEFPLPGHVLPLEEMDALAGRLSREGEVIFTLAAAAAEADFAASAQVAAWARALVLAAVRVCKWEDEARGLALSKAFVKVERVFMELCYAPEVLQEDKLFLLPPMHRFSWYCGRAFEALEANDPTGYARLLRKGLETCPQMKPMVEFLSEHTPQLQPTTPSRELQDLADKVRNMLMVLDPADPAVAALKQSPVYQKVAYLIEGMEAPVMGGLAQ